MKKVTGKISPAAYRRLVWNATKKQPIHTLPDIEKRGYEYHLDHIIPIKYGHKNNVNPEVIGHISNLRIIPAIENIRKASSTKRIDINIPLVTESGESGFVNLEKAKNEDSETMIQKLKYFRIGKGIKIMDMAKEMGVHRDTIGRLENGNEALSIGIVMKYAELLGFDFIIMEKQPTQGKVQVTKKKILLKKFTGKFWEKLRADVPTGKYTN